MYTSYVQLEQPAYNEEVTCTRAMYNYKIPPLMYTSYVQIE